MTETRTGPVRDLSTVVSWLAVLWAIFVIDIVLRYTIDFHLADHLGLRPRDTHNFQGIIFAHLLHANFAHLLANTVGLGIVGWLACRYSRSLTAIAIIESMLVAGIFTWVFGSWGDPRPLVHVGASGVIFGLIGFLLANAIFRFDFVAILVGILVGWLFWGSLPGILPVEQGGPPISWEMHLGGFVGGIIASWTNRSRKG